jgi:hypothetical protein
MDLTTFLDRLIAFSYRHLVSARHGIGLEKMSTLKYVLNCRLAIQ